MGNTTQTKRRYRPKWVKTVDGEKLLPGESYYVVSGSSVIERIVMEGVNGAAFESGVAGFFKMRNAIQHAIDHLVPKIDMLERDLSVLKRKLRNCP